MTAAVVDRPAFPPRPQRVLIVSSFVPPHVGGVEQFVGWLAERLRSSGHDVRILACDLPTARADHLVRTRLVPPHGLPWVSPSPSAMAEIRRGVEWSSAVVLQDYVHSLCLWTTIWARRLRRPTCAVLHAVYSTSLTRNPSGQYLRVTAPAMARWARPLAVSGLTEAWAARHLGRSVDRMPFPLRPLPVRTPQAGPSAAEPFRLVYAARLAAEKGPLELVEACEATRAGPVHLDVFGDGPLAAPLARLALTRPWLRLHGAQPWRMVVEAQSRAHAVVSTSRREAVGVSVLEAVGMGTPAVVTRIGDVVEYLPGDLARFVVPAGDATAAGAALDELRRSYGSWQERFAEASAALRRRHFEEAAEAAIWRTLQSAGLRAT